METKWSKTNINGMFSGLGGGWSLKVSSVVLSRVVKNSLNKALAKCTSLDVNKRAFDWLAEVLLEVDCVLGSPAA